MASHGSRTHTRQARASTEGAQRLVRLGLLGLGVQRAHFDLTGRGRAIRQLQHGVQTGARGEHLGGGVEGEGQPADAQVQHGPGGALAGEGGLEGDEEAVARGGLEARQAPPVADDERGGNPQGHGPVQAVPQETAHAGVALPSHLEEHVHLVAHARLERAGGLAVQLGLAVHQLYPGRLQAQLHGGVLRALHPQGGLAPQGLAQRSHCLGLLLHRHARHRRGGKRALAPRQLQAQLRPVRAEHLLRPLHVHPRPAQEHAAAAILDAQPLERHAGRKGRGGQRVREQQRGAEVADRLAPPLEVALGRGEAHGVARGGDGHEGRAAGAATGA